MNGFQKRIEDFVCEHCGIEVKGSGYTNHCPKCLWSKHVDVSPGDRTATCGGAMKPVALEEKGGEFDVVHKCQNCGHQKRNKLSPADDFDSILRSVSAGAAKEN